MEVIPDASGGLLAFWWKVPWNSPAQQMITHISGGVTTTYSLPYAWDNAGAVVGDNDTAFAVFAPGSPQEPLIFAFDVNSGAIKWTYQQAADSITLIAATDGGGVVAKSTSSGGDTILRFDSNGVITTDTWTASNIGNFGGSLWQGAATADSPMSGFAAAPIPLSASPWVTTDGTAGGDSAKQTYSVPNFSQDPPNQTAIIGLLQEIFQALPLSTFSGSGTCNVWLNGGQNNVAALNGFVTSTPSDWAHGTININGNPSYGTGAITSLDGPIPTTNLDTVVNDNGIYFNYQSPAGNGHYNSLQTYVTNYVGNTLLAQAQTTLHELGHQAQFPLPPNPPGAQWQQNDAGNTRAVIINETIVNKNCGSMIRALPSINPIINVPPGLAAGFSQVSGSVGSQMTITGANFGSNQGTNTVNFNGANGPVAATVSNWSSTHILVTVPNGATTGDVTVTVSGVTATGPAFTVQ
jgi:hypothetical protein